MKFTIYTNFSGTFGQTGAGCHFISGKKKEVEGLSLDQVLSRASGTIYEGRALLARPGLEVSGAYFSAPDWKSGEGWGGYSSIEPLNPAQDWAAIEWKQGGVHWLAVREDCDAVEVGTTSSLDSENAAYQRSVLR